MEDNSTMNGIFGGFNSLLDTAGKGLSYYSGFKDSEAARKLQFMQAAQPQVTAAPTAAVVNSGDLNSLASSNVIKYGVGGLLVGVGLLAIVKAFK